MSRRSSRSVVVCTSSSGKKAEKARSTEVVLRIGALPRKSRTGFSTSDLPSLADPSLRGSEIEGPDSRTGFRLAVDVREGSMTGTHKVEADDRVVSVARSVGPEKLGIVRAVGRDWLLLHMVTDLRLEGFECLRVAAVTEVSSGRHERFAARALSGERRTTTPTLPLDSTTSMLAALCPKPLVAIECERDDDFLLGKLLHVDARSAVIHSIDAACEWHPHASRVALGDITRVMFEDHYSGVFAAHAPPRPTPQSTVDR